MLILASASPRRRQLLSEYGYEFSVYPADVEEVSPEEMNVGDVTLYNARLKAEAVAREVHAIHPEAVILGVDTLVALDGKKLGKPKDMGEAAAMLCSLSGRIHEVHSGVWAIGPRQSRAFVEVSRVRFKLLDEEAIRRYLARIDPLDKAGAYAAQDEHPDGVVEAIEGSRTNVIGLPMEALERMLKQSF